jgi:hypothetical protein
LFIFCTGGLQSNADLTEAVNAYDSPWVSIVMAASAVATSVFSTANDTDTTINEISEDFSAANLDARTDNRAKDLPMLTSTFTTLPRFYAEYLYLALKFFNTCMSTRESQHVPSDIPVIGAVVGIVLSAVGPLRTLLSCYEVSKSRWIDYVYLIKPLTTALNCLELTVCKSGYQVAFRECEGFGPVNSVIEAFGPYDHRFTTFRSSMKGILNAALGLLSNVTANIRRRTVGTGANESGLQIVNQPYFSKLCVQVFDNSFQVNKRTWVHLLTLIRLAIDAEPTFLAQFLRSSYASSLSLQINTPSSKSQGFNCDAIMPLSRLAGSMCITPDGLNYVLSNRMIPFVIDALVEPSLCIPQGEGLSTDSMQRYICKYIYKYLFIFINMYIHLFIFISIYLYLFI